MNTIQKQNGTNLSIDQQVEVLKDILMQNEKLRKVLITLSHSKLKNYYVAAGCINQTVFNYYHDYPLDYGIEDFDIVYFDHDVSYEKEDSIIQYIQSLLPDLDISFDIKNEARVHLWYEEKYGMPIQPYTNLEDAISCWGTSVTCIGVRLEEDQLIVCAPYGFHDLFRMIIRPIKKQFTKESYQLKTAKWKKKWPLLTIMPWDDFESK